MYRFQFPVAAMLAGTVLLSGCSSQNPEPVTAPAPAAEPAEERPSYTGNSVVSHRIIFAFDSAELAEDAAQTITYHADYLKDNPTVIAVLQGNASSPGGHDYNYKLGLKRAQAVAQALTELGVPESQLWITSTGKHNHVESNAQAVIIAY